jgi:hypothetical protein
MVIRYILQYLIAHPDAMTPYRVFSNGGCQETLGNGKKERNHPWTVPG